jgi:hypothetical protein
LRGGAPSVDQTPHIDRSIETVRARGCDEDAAAFETKLAVIAHRKRRTP